MRVSRGAALLFICLAAAVVSGDPDQAREEVFPRLRDLMVTMSKDDRTANDQFKVYFVDWYMHRVYDELDGPLTEAIAPIPRK